jgi:hypothetical protein
MFASVVNCKKFEANNSVQFHLQFKFVISREFAWLPTQLCN